MISYVIYDIYSLQRRISFRRSPVIQSRMERMTQTDKWILMRMSCALMMRLRGQHSPRRGSNIRFANPTRFSAGCLQNWQRGSVKTLDRSSAYPPKATLSGLRGS